MGIRCRSSTSLRVTTLPFGGLHWTPGASRFSQSPSPRSLSLSHAFIGSVVRRGLDQAVHVLIAISRPRQHSAAICHWPVSVAIGSRPSCCIEYSTLAVSARRLAFFLLGYP